MSGGSLVCRFYFRVIALSFTVEILDSFYLFVDIDIQAKDEIITRGNHTNSCEKTNSNHDPLIYQQFIELTIAER